MSDLRLIRNLTGWPEAVPDDLLYAHADEALDELVRVTGCSAAPAGQEAVWERALAWLTAASALPSLHTFALNGAAKVGRLEGSVEFRFLGPADLAARVMDWHDRGLAVAAGLAVGSAPARGTDAGCAVGPGWMAAI